MTKCGVVFNSSAVHERKLWDGQKYNRANNERYILFTSLALSRCTNIQAIEVIEENVYIQNRFRIVYLFSRYVTACCPFFYQVPTASSSQLPEVAMCKEKFPLQRYYITY
jgi:hypothetical protein